MLNIQNFLKCSSAATFLALGTLISLQVSAAPQILDLLTSAKPIPLTCKNGVYTAEISAYCMQSHRESPNPGTRYNFASDGNVTILAKTSSGKSIKLALNKFASVKSARRYSVIRYSIPRKILTEHNVSSAGVVIGKFASAVPMPVKNDPNPISATELKAYTGPLRQVSEQITGKLDRSSII